MNPYVDPVWIREALKRLKLRPSKAMGQNFLLDRAPLLRALEAAQLGANDVVVEVGPGLGVLTWELARVARRVICVELDARLAQRLTQEFDSQQVRVLEADVLAITPAEILAQAGLAPDHPYMFVANIPYAITSPLLRHFLEADHPPQRMVVLMQWEVAERITAEPGKLSILAHAIQLYAEPEILLRVPAAAFLPAPAVDSALVLLRTRPAPKVDVDPDWLFKVIRAGFSQARKKLSNSLPHGLAGQGYPKTQVLAALHAVGIDPDQRAEALTLEAWARLAKELQADQQVAE